MKPPRGQLDHRVTLTCGCAIKTRSRPMNPKQMYGCTSGQAHGYSLPWKSCTGPDGRTWPNPNQEPQ